MLNNTNDHAAPCMGPHACVGCDTILDGNVIVCQSCWLPTRIGRRIAFVKSIDNADIIPMLFGEAAAALIKEVKDNRTKKENKP